MNKTAALTGKEIRNKFIEFFKDKHNHIHLKSSGLIPENPTVMLTTAGMLQFVPVFLGYEAPPNPPRAVTVQKCARAGGKDSDIENVGRTPRHHTFFEMLGNFSFGDYFKKEIIPWSWDFVTNYLKLDKDKLWITIYETDDESFEIWKEDVGVPAERIIRKGKKDNFWGPPGPTGPCGPCSEIHFDLGEKYACSDNCGIDKGCDCDRFVEIWNLVFMELNKDEEGNFTPLEKKNVDTGMGLERITMVVNGLSSTFETDLILPILEKVTLLSGKKYKDNKKDDVSLRIITDHARCVTFLISDGLIPGNEGRNYVLRMIMRRALRHGKLLGIELPFLYKIVDTIIENYKETYPELKTNREKVISTIKREEERFNNTLDRGEKLLDEIIFKTEHEKIISGENAFKLYDTFGFPLELTVEMAQEKGFKVDIEGFNKEMKEQKERARQAHVAVKLTDDLVYNDILQKIGVTEFLGYELTKVLGCVIKEIIKDGHTTESLEEGDLAEIILDKTPFYGESGGQVGDTGFIEGHKFKAEVLNTIKFNDLFIHKVKISEGEAKKEDVINAKVDEKRRKQIMAHHTSAHLLQSALRKVLGDSVAQAGSQVEPDRTRFDFSFDRAVTQEELDKIESLINNWIEADYKREVIETSPEEARKLGATALFGEKYGDKVRMVVIDNISKELCGGTHAKSTSEVRLCKIVSEGAIAAGTRRIELVCGQKAFEHLNDYVKTMEQICKKLKTPPAQTPARIEKLQEEIFIQQKKIETLEAEIAGNKAGSLFEQAENIEGGKLLIARADGIAPKALKEMVEKTADKLGNGIVLVASVADEKISIICKVSDDFVQKGYNAGQLVNEVAQKCGGKGGGRLNFAQAGASEVSCLDDAIEKLYQSLKK
ncbi:MAG TPA: alanine--tRNA ligase [Candidatus Gastranaerophilales bacterium]|nr:alanine--tRNA ligase [Candidatus Gastranaerophilales bacterium]